MCCKDNASRRQYQIYLSIVETKLILSKDRRLTLHLLAFYKTNCPLTIKKQGGKKNHLSATSTALPSYSMTLDAEFNSQGKGFSLLTFTNLNVRFCNIPGKLPSR